MLTAHEGNVEAAFQVRQTIRPAGPHLQPLSLQELNKAQLKPFLMRIWGQQEAAAAGKENNQEAGEGVGGAGEGEGSKHL